MHWKSIARAQTILGQERGTLVRDWGGLTPVALAYPNTYYLGMSSLGFQTLYRLLNKTPGLVCERVFQAFMDLRSSVTEPLLSLESQRRMDEFATLAFSLSFETDYLNMINMLRRANIPPLAEERDETYPLLLAGGPAVSANPEPLAPIFDAILIGEVEEVFSSIAKVLVQGMEISKDQLLAALAQIPGVYVPRLHSEKSTVVERQWARGIDTYPTHSVILTPNTEFGDMYLI
ncbi:MAG: radical SAM protein, partial [Chloroflexota bacterium]